MGGSPRPRLRAPQIYQSVVWQPDSLADALTLAESRNANAIILGRTGTFFALLTTVKPWTGSVERVGSSSR